MPAHSEQPEADISNAVWYLGIDFGTTGVSAVLLNRSTAQRYRIYWSKKLGITNEELRTVNPQVATRSSEETIFRFPAVAYSATVASRDAMVSTVQLSVAPVVVGSLASTLANNKPGTFLQNFKPYLNIGIPYYCPKRHDWEPRLQLPSQQIVSLYWVRRALHALLATLTPKSTIADSGINVGAVGLKSETLVSALGQLEGVILGCPAVWGDSYRLNLREAVLESKLVRHPEKIFILEDAIAAILAGLQCYELKDSKIQNSKPLRGASPDSEKVANTDALHTQNSPQGGALVINAGATTTEIALVDLPDNLQDLTHSDFSLCSLAYAGNAIDQDIFCQLLYPQLSLAQHQQLSLPSDLDLPLPGQPDQQKRDRLTSLLQSSPLGQALLKATGYLKLILQHKDEFTLELGTDRWTVKRVDLESSVLLPFIQQLNRQLNALVIETGILEQRIYQVFCIGGTAGLATLVKWLQQKLPNATIIQNADSSTDSWVAAGLATLPLYPNVLNRTQHQYSDYFLLLELLRAFPGTAGEEAARPYSIEEIMQQLERRGLNTSACYERLVRLVEGQLPPGLVPSIDNASLLSEGSKQNLQYSQVSAQPLFFQEGNQLYRLNPQQQEHLWQYLNIILFGTHQKFEEPLIVNMEVGGERTKSF